MESALGTENYNQVKKFLCSLCLSMVDEKNQFYANKCCGGVLICHQCFTSRAGEFKHIPQFCPNYECPRKGQAWACNACRNSAEARRCTHEKTFFIRSQPILDLLSAAINNTTAGGGAEPSFDLESLKKDAITICNIPSNLILPYFKNKYFQPLEFWKEGGGEISHMTLEAETSPTEMIHPVIKTKTLKIWLKSPYNYTRIVFQLLGKRLETKQYKQRQSFIFTMPKPIHKIESKESTELKYMTKKQIKHMVHISRNYDLVCQGDCKPMVPNLIVIEGISNKYSFTKTAEINF